MLALSKRHFDLRRVALALAIAALVVTVAAGAIALFYTLGSSGGAGNVINPPAQPIGGGGPPSGGSHAGHARHVPTAWIAGSGVGLFLAAAAGAVVFVQRRRQRQREEPQPAVSDDLVQVLDDTLDDLREEPDPRRAVIAAYARMERVLGRHGLGRRPSEAPFEYLARVLSSLRASEASALRLTDLFEWAKFSHHVIPESMKADAIDALLTLRHELEAL